MSRLIRFFTKILDICKLVPMLPVVVIAAIPLALLGDWRPWGNAMAIPVLGNPGFGQWLVIALVLVIVIDTVRGMIDDLRHGQVEVDVLAVVAIPLHRGRRRILGKLGGDADDHVRRGH